MGLYIEVQYSGDWWGEEPMTETDYETTGELFRALSGRDHSRPWMALGRCIGYVRVDEQDHKGRKVGWVFEARNPEPARRRDDEQPTGLRIAWVTVHDAPPTVTRTYHYARL